MRAMLKAVALMLGLATHLHSAPHVLAIAIDGVREQDALPIRLKLTTLTSRGYHLKWLGKEDGCRTSQPYNLSLPAYANFFSGSVDPRILNNTFTGKLSKPTLFDQYPNSQLFSSWEPIRRVMSNNPHLRQEHAFIVFYPEFPNVPNDPLILKAFQEFYLGSRFSFVHLVDADDYAHLGKWNEYQRSIWRQSDMILELVSHAELVLKAQPTIVVFSDHARGSWFNWRHHGTGIRGSEKIWAAVLTPDPPVFNYPLCDHTMLHSIVRATLGE